MIPMSPITPPAIASRVSTAMRCSSPRNRSDSSEASVLPSGRLVLRNADCTGIRSVIARTRNRERWPTYVTDPRRHASGRPVRNREAGYSDCLLVTQKQQVVRRALDVGSKTDDDSLQSATSSSFPVEFLIAKTVLFGTPGGT